MVGGRRFGPLMAVMVLGLFLLWTRLFQVQVVEHEVWAREAANLVRSASLLPYERGRILDRAGRVLAYDSPYYRLEFDYREFRRGHPLGQVAHARSSLEHRAVSLEEALFHLEAWALELCELTPNRLVAFGRGEALELPSLALPEAADEKQERRASRASNVHFYVTSLYFAPGREARKIGRARGEADGDLTYLELFAREAQTTVEAVREELERRFFDARSDLRRLGALLEYGAEAGEPPLDALVRDLEGARRSIEDAIADELFEEAAHFAPGRLATEHLAALDVSWISGVLAWDREREQEWIATRREGWLEWARGYGLYRALLEVDLAYDTGDAAQRLLSELANLFAPEPSRAVQRDFAGWREVEGLVCLGELADLCDVPDAPRLMEERPFALPFQEPEVRAMPRALADPFELLARALPHDATCDPVPRTPDEEPWPAPASAPESAARWRTLAAAGQLQSEEALRLLRHAFCGYEQALQAELGARLAILERHALGGGTGLAFSEARRSVALKKARHVVRDQSSRPAVVDRDPDFAVVQLVTRWHARYSGFQVRDRTRRVLPYVDEYGTPLAQELIGGVREANLREVLSQRGSLRELAQLQKKRVRTSEDEARVRELIERVAHPEEQQGGGGLESYLDPELSGKNGYVETQGLQEREDTDGVASYVPPVHGLDVRLTLDIDLQRTAQEVLENPVLPKSVLRRDELWFDNPVGAIVLLTPDGDVLAAASVPTRRHEAPYGRDGERAIVRERTLQRPRAQAPGSVFKPFVALWALQNLDWDPDTLTDCASLPGGGAGYETMHCATSYGHNELDLHDALVVSCNAYFARLGEAYDADQLSFLAAEFGFGKPTGIRSLSGRRGGLTEHYQTFGLEILRSARAPREQAKMRRQVGNGLSLLDATPMQVARATCGLLENRLPELRLIAEVDGTPLPKRGRDLGFDGRHLTYVQQALYDVVHHRPDARLDRFGSAQDALGAGDLPFEVAGKTGSADYQRFAPGTGPEGAEKANRKMRKHTWFAGWFPADDPKAVLVCYLHDVSETSSHTSVWVAKAFLQSDAVRRFVAEGE